LSTGKQNSRAGIAIGNHIVDLSAAAATGMFGKRRLFARVFTQPVLNDFIALGKPVTGKIRKKYVSGLSCLSDLIMPG
jgi:fumarylacetoacetase